MNETLLETANLYVLGLLTADEQAAFERTLASHPALQQEVHSLQNAALALAKSAPQIAPPPDLRASLLAAFSALPPSASGPELKKPATATAFSPSSPAPAKPRPSSPVQLLHFIPWAAAAALAVLFYQNKNAITEARQETAIARAETLTIKAREQQYLDAVRSSESARTQSETRLADLRTQLTQSEAALALLDKERDTLRMELAILRSESQLDKTRIAVLGSLIKDQPQAVAVSLWRQESQDGLLVVENMPALPPGRDYQLWVIDPNLKTPVSAGVFKVDAAGKVRLEFKPTRNVQSAYKFAVTIEKEGGVMVPTLDQMVVIGG